VKVHLSPLKHGISAEDAIHAATWPQHVEPLGEGPGRELRLGFDTRARMLETVVLIFDSGHELVIHAMKIRPQYESLLG
jgi:hypothetical protein